MRTLTLVFCGFGACALTGRVAFVNEFDTWKLTVVSAPGSSGPYGFEVASAVILSGSARLTVPLCGVSDQLWTTTGTVIVLRTANVWIAAERPSRRAAGAVVSSQLSYSAQLPQRWKRPSAAE